MIHELGQNQYLVSGEVSVIDRNTIEITELPVRTWTQVRFPTCLLYIFHIFRLMLTGLHLHRKGSGKKNKTTFKKPKLYCCFSLTVSRPIKSLCWSPCCRAVTKHQLSSVTIRNTTQTPQSNFWCASLKRNWPRLRQLVFTKFSSFSPALPATPW